MKDLVWHIHDGDPCSKCGCAFTDVSSLPEEDKKRLRLVEEIEDAEGIVSELERELWEARQNLDELESELSRLDKADKTEAAQLLDHPWMKARPAAKAVLA